MPGKVELFVPGKAAAGISSGYYPPTAKASMFRAVFEVPIFVMFADADDSITYVM